MRALVAIEPESSAAAASCQDETENNSNNDNTQDITEAFQCLDESGGEGRLTDEQVVTLFLGLGYQPIDIAIEDLKGRRRRSLDWEQRRVAAASIEHGGDGDWTLSQVCHVVSQVRHRRCRRRGLLQYRPILRSGGSMNIETCVLLQNHEAHSISLIGSRLSLHFFQNQQSLAHFSFNDLLLRKRRETSNGSPLFMTYWMPITKDT